MADVTQNTLEAIRAVLIGDATLIAIVPAAKIKMKDSPYPATYPAITLAISGSGGNSVIADVEFGRVDLRIYYQGAQAATNLYPIRARVKTLISGATSWADVTDADVEVHELYEYSCSPVITENEANMKNVYSLNTLYAYTAINK